jgi:hypothetical protein
MSFSTVDLHIAKKKMVLKSCSFHISFISTLWKGDPIMCYFDNIQGSLNNLFCCKLVEPEEVEQLEIIIKDFLNKI